MCRKWIPDLRLGGAEGLGRRRRPRRSDAFLAAEEAGIVVSAVTVPSHSLAVVTCPPLESLLSVRLLSPLGPAGSGDSTYCPVTPSLPLRLGATSSLILLFWIQVVSNSVLLFQ